MTVVGDTNNNTNNNNNNNNDITIIQEVNNPKSGSNGNKTESITETQPSNTAMVHQQTQAQLEAIEQEIRNTQPLTSPRMDILSLRNYYTKSNNIINTTTSEEDKEENISSPTATIGVSSTSSSTVGFDLGVKILRQTYDTIRTVRGDGNCYYRAFLYSLCESLLSNANEWKRIATFVKESFKEVISIGGYDEMAIDIFYESLVELLDSIQPSETTTTTTENKKEQRYTKLHDELTAENSTSDYCTWYLRVLTATYLKSDPERFYPYILGDDSNSGTFHPDVASYCQQQIEPMGKECSMIQVLALAEYFKVRVTIEYLDGKLQPKVSNPDTTNVHDWKLTQHVFGPDDNSNKDKANIYLLYRPGHYDILYPQK